MTDERDSDLDALFAETEEELPADAFVAGVEAGVARQKSRNLALRIAGCLGVLMIAVLFAGPVQHAVSALTLALTYPLISLDSPLLAQLLLPINNVAALVAPCLLALWPVYRRVF